VIFDECSFLVPIVPQLELFLRSLLPSQVRTLLHQYARDGNIPLLQDNIHGVQARVHGDPFLLLPPLPIDEADEVGCTPLMSTPSKHCAPRRAPHHFISGWHAASAAMPLLHISSPAAPEWTSETSWERLPFTTRARAAALHVSLCCSMQAPRLMQWTVSVALLCTWLAGADAMP
jgi:hypothetical protein